MKKLLTLIFVFVSLASFGQFSNVFTGLIIKNSKTADSSSIRKMWYEESNQTFMVWDGAGKHSLGAGNLHQGTNILTQNLTFDGAFNVRWGDTTVPLGIFDVVAGNSGYTQFSKALLNINSLDLTLIQASSVIAEVLLDATGVHITGGIGGGSPHTSIDLTGTSALFTDTRASLKGLEYAATGYVTQLHSLTDVEYVLGVKTYIGVQTFPSSSIILKNPAATFGYTFVGSAIAANRNLTLPLLTGNDVMVTEAFTQTLTNKTINGTNNTITNVSLTGGVTGILPGANGGTGVANTSKTITLGGNLITSGAFATTLTTTATTNLTLPTNGTVLAYSTTTLIGGNMFIDDTSPGAHYWIMGQGARLSEFDVYTQGNNGINFGSVTTSVFSTAYTGNIKITGSTNTVGLYHQDPNGTFAINMTLGAGGIINFQGAGAALTADLFSTYNIGGSTNGNISLLSQSTTSYGGGTKVIFIGDSNSNPSTNPTGGFLLYSDNANASHPTIRLPSGVIIDLSASGGMTNPMTAVGDLIQGTTAGAPVRLASVATGNALISGGVTTANSWGKITSAHIDATVQTAGLSWLLTGTSTLTGAVVIDQTTTGANTLKFLTPTLGVTSIDGKGLWIQNATAAAAGAQQISGGVLWEGQGWATTPVASQSVKFIADVLPVQGAANPTGLWRLRSSINGAAYTQIANFTSTGQLLIATGASSGASNLLQVLGNIAINSSSGVMGMSMQVAGQDVYIDASLAAGGINLRTNGSTIAGSFTSLQNFNVGVANGNNLARLYVLQPALISAGGLPAFQVDGGAHTSLTASTEVLFANFNSSATVQYATGAQAILRNVLVQAPTIRFTGASVVTDNATFTISGAPKTGTNATQTNAHGLLIQAAAVTSAGAAFGLTSNAPTGGTLNYSAQFLGGIGVTFSQVAQSTTHTFISFTQSAHTGGSPTLLKLTTGAGTGLSPGGFDIFLTTATQQFVTGNVSSMGSVALQGPTWQFVGASTITDAYATNISYPQAHNNATFTNDHAILIQSRLVTGGTGVVINSYGATINAATGATNNYAAQFLGGSVGIGTSAPTALLSISGGTTTVPPLGLTSGTNLTTPLAGAFEYNGVNLFFTPSGTTRKTASLYQVARSTAQTGANASVTTWTVGANDGTFLVSANVLVTASTTHAFTVTCTYTDEGNTSRTVTLTLSQLGGTLGTSVANTAGTVPYEGIPLHIRCKAATTITIGTTGTFTSVTYNVEGSIAQIN